MLLFNFFLIKKVFESDFIATMSNTSYNFREWQILSVGCKHRSAIDGGSAVAWAVSCWVVHKPLLLNYVIDEESVKLGFKANCQYNGDVVVAHHHHCHGNHSDMV